MPNSAVIEKGLEEREIYDPRVLGLGELVVETLKDIEPAEG